MKQRHPRINCCITGCKRGTTQFEPGCLVICGKCWRKAPKPLRTRYTDCHRMARKYRRRLDEEKASVFEHRAHRVWCSIRDVLEGRDTEAAPTGLPPLMAEELRSIGLA